MQVSEADSTFRLTRNYGFHNKVFSASHYSPFSRGDLGRQTVKQAAMTQIWKGVKSNDISKILGKPPSYVFPQVRQQFHSLNQDREDISFDQKKDIHNNLLDIQKKYNELKTQNLQKERELQKLREENERIKKTQSELNNQVNSAFTNEAEVQNKRDAIKLEYEQAFWQRKSYTHIRSRLTSDQLAYKIKTNKIQKDLNTTVDALKQAETFQYQSKQFAVQTQKVMDNMMKSIEEEHQQREEELYIFKDNIRERQDLEREKEDRLRNQINIAEHAFNDKDNDEKQWRKLLIVHKFVNTMFKTKMQREMKKFEVVEKSFQKIKQATGVSEASEIVNKFLQREQTYGELLASIADYEKRIEYLKRNNEKNHQKLEDLKQELATMESLQKKSKTGTKEQEYFKKIEEVDEKTKKAQLQKEKLYQWCIKILLKNDKLKNEESTITQKINYFDKFPRQDLVNLFKETCKVIDKLMLESQDVDMQLLLENLNQTDQAYQEIQDEEFIKRNKRIKPQAKQNNFSLHSKDGSSKKSDSMNRTNSLDSDSEHGNVDEKNEIDYVNFLREDLKTQEELIYKKKKFEEERKKNAHLRPKEGTKKKKQKNFDDYDLQIQDDKLEQTENNSPQKSQMNKKESEYNIEPTSPMRRPPSPIKERR